MAMPYLRFRSLEITRCAAAEPTKADLSPYERGFNLEYGLLAERIRPCPTDVNPNCVSTSSTNDTYSPAWQADASSVSAALNDFESALLGLQPEAEEVDLASGPGGAWQYRRYRVDSQLFGSDYVEVLIREQPQEAGPLVMYRSMAGSVKYIWPITQPVGDMGAQRQRVRALRQRLGWRLLGCDLIECYQE